MSVYNDSVSSASPLSELWLAPVSFLENAGVGTVGAFAEGVADPNELQGRYP
ncbi:hypothetical protein [Rhodanobacter sp. MP7CTX1]|jgi:hypothetical protein|uniref:hypothetical protein n=1 Tax=Rhodanobacter sp. MP7CTX1 TaxID=2723084 RepID=UPI001610852D|nr:hypothetical protein [Rhodanobacter sp. MP7CTX1]MBB6186240.1 hypothetical protein [Rhodanobacter sp. MP7CTX1]